MKIILKTTFHLWRWTVHLASLLLILAALLLPLGRLLSTQLNAYRADVEASISAYLGAPVHIQALQVIWQGWTPTLHLDGFRLDDPTGQVLQADFQQAWVRPALLDSLLSGQWVLNNIHLEGLRLVLQRDDSDIYYLVARLQGLAVWLLHIRSLDVVFQEWELRDLNSTEPPLIFHDLRLSLRNHQRGTRRLDLAVQLPATLGNSLLAAGEWYGDSADPRTWSASFYLRGKALNWTGWPLPVKPIAGLVNQLELWGDWQQQSLQTLRGKASWQALTPSGPPDNSGLRKLLANLPVLTTAFNWQRDTGGWQLHSNWTGLDRKGTALLHSTVDLTLLTPRDGTAQRLEGRCRDLRLQDLAALATPWLDTTQRTLLADLNPRGQLPELLFRIPLDNTYAPLPLNLAQQGGDYALAARFQQLATRSGQNVPGIQGLSGSLTLDQDRGRLDLETGSLRVDAANLWRAPVNFDTLRGAIQWQRETAGLRLESTGLTLTRAAFNTRLQGQVTLYNDGSSPLLELSLKYKNLDIEQLRHYLPTAVMKPHLVDWLDRALVSGRIPAGELVLQGRLTDFPFDEGQGLFETRLQVVDTILDYQPEWPRLEELEAEVVFRNRSLQVEAVAGKLLHAELKRAQAGIADLAHPVLEIQGQAQGPTVTLLRLLRESPLAHSMWDTVKTMQATGNNTVDLKLHIPLDTHLVAAQGTVHFAGNSLTLPAWNLELQHIQGGLDFTEAGLAAKDIRLLWHGEPLRLDIDTSHEPGGGTHFSLHGQPSLSALAGGAAAALTPYMDGRGQWDAVLTIPAGRSNEFTLELASDLAGVTVRLPPPLDKSAATRRAFKARFRLDRKANLQLQLHYEPAIEAALEFVDFPDRSRFKRGELRIDSGAAQLPETAGLAVVAHLPRLTLPAPEQGAVQNPLFPPWLSTVAARFDELRIGNQAFAQVAVRAIQRGDRLTLTLDSEAIAGRLSVPTSFARETPLEIELQRLALHSTGQTPEQTSLAYDPRTLPLLRVTVKDLSLNDNSLGSLRLSTIPQVTGLRLSELQLRSDFQQITASGDWLMTATGPLSHLQAELHSKDLGRTLQVFGYKAALEGGKTEAGLNVNWPASLPAFAPELLRGTLSVQVGQGRLPEVEPGVGRLVGLVNVFSLARRLRLDFGDLFEQGLSFDRIEGNFTFAGGRADTDVTLEAPSAQILIDGQVNLKQRDYQQTVTVTPHISSPLVIAGSIGSIIAGATPMGAAVFLAGQILKPGIDRIARSQYSVTGSWENPVIERTDARAATHEAAVPVESNAPAAGGNR